MQIAAGMGMSITYRYFSGSCKKIAPVLNPRYATAALQPIIPYFQYAPLRLLFERPVFGQVQ